MIKGPIGKGKTFFTKELLMKLFCNKHIALVDPHQEYSDLKNSLEYITIFTPPEPFTIVNLDLYLSILKRSDYDLIVIEEVYIFDFNQILKILQINPNVVLFAHELTNRELFVLGKHICISINGKESNIITHNRIINNSLCSLPILVEQLAIEKPVRIDVYTTSYGFKNLYSNSSSINIFSEYGYFLCYHFM
ncbi:DUF87 domain-containing protein [Niallia alba]|uniref:helicase HerA domain-containing protein n=1 Tax=Niallia TaxID=2837506 RepID=UPI001642BD32